MSLIPQYQKDSSQGSGPKVYFQSNFLQVRIMGRRGGGGYFNLFSISMNIKMNLMLSSLNYQFRLYHFKCNEAELKLES